MKIQINLATRPFVELRPLFARLRITMALLAVVAAGLGFALHAMTAKANDAQQKVAAVKDRTDRLREEKLKSESRMRQPQNAAVLDRSRFLNEMFARKSFSWTAVMMDLEEVLPGGVQVTSIEPNITADGDVNIRLKVSGDRDRAVQLVRNLETSKRFLSPRLSDESIKTQTEGAQRAMAGPAGVEFDILAGYNPLPSKPMADAAKDANDSKDAKDAKGTKDAARNAKSTKTLVKTANPAAKKVASAAPNKTKPSSTKPGSTKPADAKSKSSDTKSAAAKVTTGTAKSSTVSTPGGKR
jgi:type IV pilus assembly protein PilN